MPTTRSGNASSGPRHRRTRGPLPRRRSRSHQAFRSATAAATGAEATEAAARRWLDEINQLNTQTRDALRQVETGNAELRAALPRLDRLALEADAARIAAEGAEAACHEAREALARCEEPQAAAAVAAAAAESASVQEPPPWTRMGGRPVDAAAPEGPGPGQDGPLPVIVRMLEGDRAARERLVAALSEDAESGRAWHLRLAQLVDAITARSIEDGYLDMPDDHAFWGLFLARERREIVQALAALGFRYDGLGGFADDRVPAPRDLSLAVGYAGLERMRIRNWPREADLPGLFAGASVASGEWLAHEAGDLSLGEMVDALGSRAAELADVWNAWGRMRPVLLATD